MVMVIINVLNAWYYTCFGPVIPYYSAATGLDETHYSYLFLIKTVATVLGGYLAKYLIKRVPTQPLIIIYMILAIISLCASTFSLSTINLGITLFIATFATVGPALIGFNVTLKLFLDDEP
jgi:predicted MFS family arabinose efflux permease